MISRNLCPFIMCLILVTTASLFGNYSVQIDESESVQLKVTSGNAADDEQFSYSWYQDGVMIAAEKENEMVLDAEEGSAGNYEIKCVAVNEFARIEFVWELAIAASSNSAVALPLKTELFQNYPNPFNPETNISYVLSKAGDVKITVYNFKGELVSELVNEYKPAGYHSLKFDGSSLSSGMYFCHILADDYRATKRAVLLK